MSRTSLEINLSVSWAFMGSSDNNNISQIKIYFAKNKKQNSYFKYRKSRCGNLMNSMLEKLKIEWFNYQYALQSGPDYSMWTSPLLDLIPNEHLKSQ